MKQLFVDTSGWDALADKADKYHTKALQFRKDIGISEVFAFDHHFEQMGLSWSIKRYT